MKKKKLNDLFLNKKTVANLTRQVFGGVNRTIQIDSRTCTDNTEKWSCNPRPGICGSSLEVTCTDTIDPTNTQTQ